MSFFTKLIFLFLYISVTIIRYKYLVNHFCISTYLNSQKIDKSRVKVINVVLYNHVFGFKFPISNVKSVKHADLEEYDKVIEHLKTSVS